MPQERWGKDDKKGRKSAEKGETRHTKDYKKVHKKATKTQNRRQDAITMSRKGQKDQKHHHKSRKNGEKSQ